MLLWQANAKQDTFSDHRHFFLCLVECTTCEILHVKLDYHSAERETAARYYHNEIGEVFEKGSPARCETESESSK